jgi:hypothetical protein
MEYKRKKVLKNQNVEANFLRNNAASKSKKRQDFVKKKFKTVLNTILSGSGTGTEPKPEPKHFQSRTGTAKNHYGSTKLLQGSDWRHFQ